VARTADRTGAGAAPVRTVRRDRPLADLENDLADARRTLLTTIEDLECANEELVSIVEELQSSNEELHGANEELESTKEELQAANEELVGVNDELQSRIAELRVASDDVQNLLDLSPSAIVLVGMDGRLRRFNEAARQLFGIGHAQLGLPLDRLTKPLGAQQVDRIVGEVIDKLVPFDDRVAGPDGRPYAVRVIPYKTSERAIRGALISVSVAPTRAAEGLRPEVP
jgi:two-component system CheB/CheR fusion protein